MHQRRLLSIYQEQPVGFAALLYTRAAAASMAFASASMLIAALPSPSRAASVDGLMRGLFSLKLTRYIRETGEQLLFRAGELLDVGDGVYGHAAFFTYVIDEPADRLGLLAKLFIGESGLERGEAVDDDGRRMPTGDKAINLGKSFHQGRQALLQVVRFHSSSLVSNLGG